MTRKIKLMLAFLAILALALTSCAKLQARDNLNKGVRAFTDAHYENAVNYFKQAMQLDPDLTVAEVYLGTAYSQMFIPNAQSEENQKNAEMAIATFQNVLRKDPNNTNAIAGLAYLYQNTGDLQKAHDYYMKNAELDSTNAVPFYAVGSVDWIMVYNKNNPLPEEEQAKLVEEGLLYLDKALAKNPEYEDAMSYKNLLYREKARLSKDEKEKAALIAQADEWFNKALETHKKLQEQKKAGGGVATTSDSK